MVAGITIEVGSELPITDATFLPRFKIFEVPGPGEDNVRIYHLFSLPPDKECREVYRKAPWIIYRREDSWKYAGVLPDGRWFASADFNRDFSDGRIYHLDKEVFERGGLSALTLLPGDEIFLAQVLSLRKGCYVHSSGVVLDGKGLLFVGHSGAGKSTMVRMIEDEVKVLGDERIIVRRWPEGFHIHGTWAHGDVPDVSSDSAPLRALLFLEKARENTLTAVKETGEIIKRLLPCVIRPFPDAGWWQRTLSLVERMVREIPCYTLKFERSKAVIHELKRLCEDNRVSAYIDEAGHGAYRALQ